MSDQTGLVALPNTFDLDQVRLAFLAGLGEARLLTAVHHTTGPNTLDGTQDVVSCDCTAGSFSELLPAAPVDGDTYRFKKKGATNTLTIDRNGKTIDFLAANLTLTADLSWLEVSWSAAANTWLSFS